MINKYIENFKEGDPIVKCIDAKQQFIKFALPQKKQAQ